MYSRGDSGRPLNGCRASAFEATYLGGGDSSWKRVPHFARRSGPPRQWLRFDRLGEHNGGKSVYDAFANYLDGLIAGSNVVPGRFGKAA